MAGPHPESSALGLIAGTGSLPIDVARSARQQGRKVVVVAFHRHTDPGIEAEVAAVTWLHPGQVERGVEALSTAGVSDAVMAGKLPKAALFAGSQDLHLDDEAERLLEGLDSRSDGSLLAAVADHLERCGISLMEQTALVPELLAPVGSLGPTRPGAGCRADIAFGWPIAVALAGLGVGQTVVVKERAVLAVEAIEGTDAAIRRAGTFARGATVVKVAGEGQDLRFDLPAIGPETAEVAAEAGVAALAFEAGRTVVLDRARLVEVAEAHGIALVGVPASGLPEGAA